MGQVNVLVLGLTGVELITQVWIRVIRGAVVNRVGFCQHTITLRSGGSTSEQVDLEFFALVVGSLRLVSDRGRQRLWVAGASKARHTDLVAIVDVLRSLFRGSDLVFKEFVKDTVSHVISPCSELLVRFLGTPCSCIRTETTHGTQDAISA